MKIIVEIINAFMDGSSGGNPAGVVLDADRFTNEQKQQIAKKVGLSETAFVSSSDTAGFKLEFFTPSRQIAHCGHATVATFSYLKKLGHIEEDETSKETIDGNRRIRFVDTAAYMEQKSPVYEDVSHLTTKIAAALGVNESVLFKPFKVDTGNAFFIVQLDSKEILKNLNPDYNAIEKLSEEHGLIGFYPFTLETNYPNSDANTRMFAPRYGIQEESATGMAAGPLASYLHDVIGVSKSAYIIEQGFEMVPSSKSIIHVYLNFTVSPKKTISSLMAGGEGNKTGRVNVEI